MVASSLIESVFADGSSTERSRRAAAQFMQAALSELAQIEKLDDSLAPDDPVEFDRRTASLIRNEYELWSTNAAMLLQSVERFEKSGGSEVEEVNLLRRAYGKTRARLSISLDEMELSLKALAEGRVIPMGEVRRGIL